MSEETREGEENSGPSLDLDLLKSYLTFARHALWRRRWLIGFVMVVGLAITGVVAKYIPRTYTCTTVLMTVENAVLDGNGGPRPLVAAEGLIMRRENLAKIIKDIDLVRKYPARRPPILRTKDRLMAALVGPQSDETIAGILIGTLENRLVVSTKENTLEIMVDWNDGPTTAEIAKAAQDSFLKIRHQAEISAFQEKMGILDVHAAQMSQEIDSLAQQMQAALEAKAAEVAKEKSNRLKVGNKVLDLPAIASASPRLSSRSKAASPDAATGELRDKLAAAKQRLAAMENDRSARMSAEKSKLEELTLRLMPNHPQVITQQNRLAMASEVPSELALLRAEVSDMQVQLKQREAMATTGPISAGSFGRPASRPAAVAAAEVLPEDIMALLEREDVDPALSAQMSGAVVRYASLRDEVRGAKLALDTAQAAFNHRYQVVVPVETPNSPVKPKIPVIIGIGFALSLLVAIGLPLAIELKRGVLIERWQVDHLQFPVLADLRLPERSDR